MCSAAQNGKVGSVLVLGGGIGGMQAALDLAASGIKVYVAESKPSIGGVMAQLDKTFPTNDCAMCTQAPRLVEVGRHKDIELLTMSEIESLGGTPGAFHVSLRKRPRYVDESKCTGCGTCTSMCPTRNVAQPLPQEEIVLPAEIRDKVEAIAERHHNRSGPLMPILQDINAVFNYFPPQVLEYVSQLTGYPLAHVYRIATFYSVFSTTPRGRLTIQVCMGTTCYVRGSERLMEKFSDILGVKPGETTRDLGFTLQSVRCIGCCGLAPAVMVGESVHGKLRPQEIPELVGTCRQGA